MLVELIYHYARPPIRFEGKNSLDWILSGQIGKISASFHGGIVKAYTWDMNSGQPKRLLEQVREVLWMGRDALGTERADCNWTQRYGRSIG